MWVFLFPSHSISNVLRLLHIHFLLLLECLSYCLQFQFDHKQNSQKHGAECQLCRKKKGRVMQAEGGHSPNHYCLEGTSQMKSLTVHNPQDFRSRPTAKQ